MDYRSTRGNDGHTPREDSRRRPPQPITDERPAPGPNTTEMIHRALFSDYDSTVHPSS